MKYQIMRVILLVTAIAAQALATKVHLFQGAGCTEKLELSQSVLNDAKTCSKISNPTLTVTEWANNEYNYIKLSDRSDEIILFIDEAACEAYTADSTVPVPFIRATTMDECTPCYKCGNIQSVQFDTTTESKMSAAGATAPSVLVAVAAAAITALFA
ncbi:hypothetical protein SARC_07643 [Sphaeroforma arctica JP610]|uniref:Uncharacterized protein n=1 Tax=Sphaeroforma arctica JP610 TaxID=667725 RepID=A0A0L0FVM1_9EUKA|nr:hypothetical protein SARC_07643 [Sphaeroforma arctica JP610]KNC79988.1 hypothetical protein SARC_07643 [Sphaeroforma arctica JP610]|eukprot:XP_014153890.1 hypothetical protein SARC_07643 [Sphaeroforma arctica JP610]